MSDLMMYSALARSRIKRSSPGNEEMHLIINDILKLKL